MSEMDNEGAIQIIQSDSISNLIDGKLETIPLDKVVFEEEDIVSVSDKKLPAPDDNIHKQNF